MTRPSCATGTPGPSRACARASSPSRMVDGRPQGAGTPVAPGLAGDSPSKPFGGAEELAWSPDGRTLYFTLREGGRTEPNSTNLDIYRRPRRRQRRRATSPPPIEAWIRRPRSRPTAAGSPTPRWRAPTYEADRQVVQLRNLAHRRDPRADRGLGPLGRLDRLGAGRPQPARHRRRHARHAGLPGRRPHRPGHPPHPGGHGRQCRAAARRRASCSP